MAPTTSLNIDQLKRAVALYEQIEKLQAELAALFGDKTAGKRGRKPGRKAGGRKAKAAEAEAAGTEAPAKKPRKKRAKREISPEARERIAAAQRKRWAKAKKEAA
jgi:hypothetical protein